ncbi:hypothetical protein V9T40_009717 [Parthenolecanium corni]|uniref:MI domain-containing protein n=1 Tax=Parthenolecanium corni TaxID=536013 RepID=A0AAN9TQC9_9HEMI
MDIQKTLSAIIETFTPSSLEESVQQIKALSLNDPPNLNYLSNLILQKVGLEADMAKEYARLCAALQEIDVFKVVLVDNCKTEFEKVIDKHIRMKSRHQEFFMSMTRGVLLNDEPSDVEEENKLRCSTMRLCNFIGELFLLKVLASKAVCRCIDVLLTANDDFSLDCLCTLLSTCGKQLEENLRKKGSEAMDFYFSSINIVTVYNEKFNISNEVAYKARRLAALREMTWDIRVDVEKQAQKNQEAKKKAKKEKKRLKKERERRAKDNTQDKDFSETDTNDKDEYCYRGRSDVTISPSTFPKREITKECPHKNEIVDIVVDMVEDLVEEKDFKRSAHYVESYFSGSEKKNIFLTKLIQYVLDKNSIYRYAVGELLSIMVKSNFYQPHQMMQQLIFLFNESQHLLIDIPCLWYNIGELYSALIREEYITLPDLKAAIETAGFKRSDMSANFVCNLLTVLRHNEGDVWVQLVAWDNSILTLGDFIAPTEIRYYINRFELNYLVSRPSIVDPVTKELSVINVKKILVNYISLDEEKAFSRIYKWSQNHIGDKIESPEFLTALTLAICEFSVEATKGLETEKLKRHSKILVCYVKESPALRKTCIKAVEKFTSENENARESRAEILTILRDEKVLAEDVAMNDLAQAVENASLKNRPSQTMDMPTTAAATSSQT